MFSPALPQVSPHRRQVEPAICADDDCGVYEVLQLVIESGDGKATDVFHGENGCFAVSRSQVCIPKATYQGFWGSNNVCMRLPTVCCLEL